MTTSTPPPHPRSPLPIHNNYSNVRTTPGDEFSSNNNNSSSWRTLSPPPKTNTMAKSPLEARVFHHLVDYLQNEQLHQSIMSQQQPAVAATTTILPDVHAIDSDSVMSFLTAAEPDEEQPQHECGRSQPQLAPTTTTTSPPPHGSTSAKSSSTPAAVVDVLTPRRNGHDDELYHYNFDNNNNHQNKNDAMIEQQAELDEVLVHDDTTSSSAADDDDDDAEDAETWQWSWHHPKLAQFPDVASSVGSIELITSYHPALLVKTPPGIAKENEQEEGEESSRESVTWKCFWWGSNSRSIRLVRLATIGRMISGRVHTGKREILFYGEHRNTRSRRKEGSRCCRKKRYPKNMIRRSHPSISSTRSSALLYFCRPRAGVAVAIRRDDHSEPVRGPRPLFRATLHTTPGRSRRGMYRPSGLVIIWWDDETEFE
jgi:hypothetical protein